MKMDERFVKIEISDRVEAQDFIQAAASVPYEQKYQQYAIS
jgi:hypothetical protein